MSQSLANLLFGICVGFTLAVVVGVFLQYRELRKTRKWYEDHPS
jgi:hypothetical protein